MASGIERLLVIAIDRRSAGIGLLVGSSLRLVKEVSSGIAGKLYRGRSSLKPFFSEIYGMIKDLYTKGSKLVISGPSLVKHSMADYLRDRIEDPDLVVIDGIDVAGSDGVLMTIGSEGFRKALKGSKFARISGIVNEFVRRLVNSPDTVAMGIREAIEASGLGAIDSMVISDRVFKEVDEGTVIELLNRVEGMGGKAYLIDDSTSLGRQVSLNGGIIALLRFPLRKAI